MKEFKRWLVNDITKEYSLYQDKDGYNIGNTPALKAGWKAALEWVLNHRKPYYNIDDKKVVATDSDIIYKELEEE